MKSMGKKLNKKELKSALKSSMLNLSWTDRINISDRFSSYTIYKHNDGGFILVFSSTGQAVWSDEEALENLYQFQKSILRNLERGIHCNVDHWRFYTTAKDNIPLLLENLIPTLRSITKLSVKDLDFSLKSIKKIDDNISNFSYREDQFLKKIYDPLVGYIGELMRLKSSGDWILQDGLPCILTPGKQILRPINVVSGTTMSLGITPLYKETRREIYKLRYES